MFKTVIIMFMAVTAGTVGDILLAKGMKEMGTSRPWTCGASWMPLSGP